MERTVAATEAPSLTPLSTYRDIFWHYDAAREAAERFTAATEAIDRVNAALNRETDRFYADQHFWNGTDVYIYDGVAQTFTLRNRVITTGRRYAFIGDQLTLQDGRLLLADTERGVAIAVDGPLTTSSLDKIERSGEQKELDELLARIAALEPGTTTNLDYMYS